MSKVSYTKPALTLGQQISQLRSRGMTITDEQSAEHYLGHLNYYRLAAYWLPFESIHQNHTFVHGTTFELVLDRYLFDRELRLLLIDAIERVEVAVRSQFAYQLGLNYGAHCLQQSALFYEDRNKWQYRNSLQQLIKDANDSKEIFIRHLLDTYNDPLPPIWATVEIMTLGQLSKWYANLKHSSDRNLVANQFDFDEVNLVSFMHHLAIVRNLCAHHSRVWNRQFTFAFKLPRKKPAAVLGSLNNSTAIKLYNTLVILAYFLDQISPDHSWKRNLMRLLKQYKIPESEMGFPAHWQQCSIWR